MRYLCMLCSYVKIVGSNLRFEMSDSLCLGCASKLRMGKSDLIWNIKCKVCKKKWTTERQGRKVVTCEGCIPNP